MNTLSSNLVLRILCTLLILAAFGCGKGFQTPRADLSSATLSSTAPAVVNPPVITQNLTNFTVAAGGALGAGQFCVTATGDVLEYAWTKGGLPAPYNANRRCYLVPVLTFADSGTYTVTIKNAVGTITATAMLAVAAAPGAPVIAQQLGPLPVVLGSAINAGQFCVTAVGDALTYSWTKNGVAIPTTTRCFISAAVTAADSGTYAVTVRNAAGSVMSSAMLSVYSPPMITQQLMPLSVSVGSALTAGQFCVTATGDGLTYSWTKDGAPIPTTTRCLLSASVTAADAGGYVVTVRNLAGSIASNEARLTIATSPLPPVLTAPMAAMSVNLGSALVAGQFCVIATGDALTYSWSKDGFPIATTTRCFLASAVTAADTGTYAVTVRNAAGSVTSLAKLSVISPPMITQQLVALSVNVSSALAAGEFCVAATGDALTYSWTKNGVTIAVSTRCFLSAGVTTADSGSYIVTVKNSAGSVASNAAQLTIVTTPLAPFITSPLAALSVSAGSALVAGQFCVTATGDALMYSWTKDGVAIATTTRCFLATALTAANAGTYAVTVRNAAGSVKSLAMLAVIAPPTITRQLPALSVNVGSALTAGQLCVTATGSNLTYSWTKNAIAIATTTRCFFASVLTAADAGSYIVTVKNSAGSVASNAAQLTIVTAPLAPVITSPLAALIANEGAALVAGQFCVSAQGSNLSYSWTKNAVAIPTTTRCFLASALTAADAGRYIVTVSNSEGFVNSVAELSLLQAPTEPKAEEELIVSKSFEVNAPNFYSAVTKLPYGCENAPPCTGTKTEDVKIYSRITVTRSGTVSGYVYNSLNFTIRSAQCLLIIPMEPKSI